MDCLFKPAKLAAVYFGTVIQLISTMDELGKPIVGHAHARLGRVVLIQTFLHPVREF